MTWDDATRVRLLLESMYDWVPSPPVSRVYSGALPGPQPSRWVRCDLCDGVGRLRNRRPCHVCKSLGEPARGHGCSMCAACDGRGERRRRKGEAEHDAYTGLTIEDAIKAREADALKRGRKRPSFALSDDEGAPHDEDPMWRAREMYERQGSYAELRRALESLRAVAPGRYERLMHWLARRQSGLLALDEHGKPITRDGMPEVRCEWWRWSKGADEDVRQTIEILARAMPKPIRLPNIVAGAARIWARLASEEAA